VGCLFNKILTNERPQQALCPSGDDSWCKSKKSASSGVACERKLYLPAAVLDVFKPVFKDLAGVDPLKNVFMGKLTILMKV
jgi:hypothetical protein